MKDIKNFIYESSQDDVELMTQDLFDWWDEHCTVDGYSSHSEFTKDMRAMAKKQNDKLVDDAFDYLTNECEWDEKDVERWEDDLVHVLAQMAQDALMNSINR